MESGCVSAAASCCYLCDVLDLREKVLPVTEVISLTSSGKSPPTLDIELDTRGLAPTCPRWERVVLTSRMTNDPVLPALLGPHLRSTSSVRLSFS
jgi:hypothetical protein